MNTSKKTTGAALVIKRPSDRLLRSIQIIALMFSLAVMDAPSLGAQVGRGSSAPYLHNHRVVSLIVHLADQAHLSPDVQFAVRAQWQAGLLVWPYNRERARAIFRRAFQQLLPSAYSSQPASAAEIDTLQRLRTGLLNQLAYCDPEMADLLAREFARSKELPIVEQAGFAAFDGDPSFIADRGAVDAEGRELLVSVALRVAEVNSERAMGLGQLSLEAGISPNLNRLLMLIEETNPPLADRLFSNAVDYLERLKPVLPGDVHTLCFYLISSDGASRKDRRAEEVIIRFLDLAFDVVMRNCPVNQKPFLNTIDQSFAIYCTARYLTELLPRYLPDRASQLQRRLSKINDREPLDSMTGKGAEQSIHPFAIEQVARDSADARESDLLYARAAFAWLARKDMREAQRAALNISNSELRDRALLTVARQSMSKARIKDALLIAPLIHDRIAKTDLIVRLAQAAFSVGNTTCAKTLLDVAELEAARIEKPLERTQSLLAIVAGFSPFNSARAFAVMQKAVKTINETSASALNSKEAGSDDGNAQEKGLLEQGFTNSLTALASLDFDRALLFAQQLTDKETSLMAQLAVCRAGLRPISLEQRGEK